MTMEIQTWPVAKLVPYARALRRNDAAVDRMAAAIKEYNCILPLLVRSDGEIVDGHLRLKAARKLQITEVQVIVCDDWTPAQVKAFRLLINRSAAWAKWDWKQVAMEIADLVNLNFDLTLTGFDALEIEKLVLGLRGEDSDAPSPQTDSVAVSSPQNLWLCGAHRILCGDSTNADDVGRLFGESKPELMVTDPPYGVSYEPTWREEAGLGKQRQTGKVVNDDRVDWSEAYRLFPGNVAYVWHAGIYARESADSLVASGFTIRSQIIWAKQHFAMSRGDYHWQHEPCWYAVRNGQPANWRGGRKESTLWEVANLNPFGATPSEDVTEDAVTGHGTQKPVALMRRPMLNHTEKGAVVYDPFLGSGSTLIAADSVDRICYGVEISPGYVDTVIERWQKMSGMAAVRDADGRSFDELRAERDGGAGTETVVAEIFVPEGMPNVPAQV
jgi:DNA modification methylase